MPSKWSFPLLRSYPPFAESLLEARPFLRNHGSPGLLPTRPECSSTSKYLSSRCQSSALHLRVVCPANFHPSWAFSELFLPPGSKSPLATDFFLVMNPKFYNPFLAKSFCFFFFIPPTQGLRRRVLPAIVLLSPPLRLKFCYPVRFEGSFSSILMSLLPGTLSP